MRFEFEFADPSHLLSVLRVIKRIDGVYDANRVLPGVATDEIEDEDVAHPSAAR
jgi:GTP pyrophosphokinase